jgi:hypothetical protein
MTDRAANVCYHPNSGHGMQTLAHGVQERVLRHSPFDSGFALSPCQPLPWTKHLKAKFSPAHARFRAPLVKARKSAGLRQVDVAKRLGRPQSYVAKVEQGERRLDIVEIVELTHAIDADPVKLLREVIKALDG